MVRGCKLENYIGIATQCTGDDQGVANLLVLTHRYKSGVTGWFDPITDAFDFQVPQSGVLRVIARTSATFDFSTAAAQLVGPQKLGVRVTCEDGDDGYENNGTWQVQGAGRVGNLPYVDLVQPDAMAATPADPVEVRIARVPDGETWEGLVHPDLLQVNATCVNFLFTNVRAHDVVDSQGLFGKDKHMTRCAFVNVTVGVDGGSKFESEDSSASLDHVLMRHVTGHREVVWVDRNHECPRQPRLEGRSRANPTFGFALPLGTPLLFLLPQDSQKCGLEPFPGYLDGSESPENARWPPLGLQLDFPPCRNGLPTRLPDAPMSRCRMHGSSMQPAHSPMRTSRCMIVLLEFPRRMEREALASTLPTTIWADHTLSQPA